MSNRFGFAAGIVSTAIIFSVGVAGAPAESANTVTIKQFNALKAQVEALQGQLNDLSTTVDENSASLADADATLTNLSYSVSTATSKISSIEANSGSTQALAKKVLAASEKYVYQVECANGLGSAWGKAVVLSAAEISAGYAGAVVTNYHVVSACLNQNVRVSQNGRTLGGKVSYWDSVNDLAIVITQGVTNALPLSQTAPSRGDFALALGSPYGLEGSVSVGIVSNLNGDFVVTDAAIDPGNSGGPLLNANGELIGINTWKYSGSQGNGNAIKPGVLCRNVLVCSADALLLAWSK